jgi:small subunit ribosomal protein S8
MHSHGIKFLLALKNASVLKKELVFFYYNNLFLKLAKVLYRTGLIQNFCIEKKKKKNFQIIISLKYSFNNGILNSLKIISKPSISLFLDYEKLCRVSEKNRILILSTDQGFLSGEECKKRKIGGKVFFYA